MRTMVTGGAGFIGSCLVDRLMAEGCQVDVVDDLSSGSLANLSGARMEGGSKFGFHQMDIRSSEMVDLIALKRPEVIFHLAAQANVRHSVERPVFDAEVNITGTLRVLEGARSSGVTRVVFAASGGTLYGEPGDADLPITETCAHHPLSPYGVSKKAGIDYLEAFRCLYGIDYCALALANVYGPRQDPHGEAGVIAIFAERLLKHQPLTIYGDGGQTRDFVFVDDVVDAFVKAGHTGGGRIVNIGTGHEVSVNKLAGMMMRAASVDVAPVYAPERPGELRRNALDPALASEHLGWYPWTELESGVSQVVEYFRESNLLQGR